MYDLWHISSFTLNVKGDDIQTRLSIKDLRSHMSINTLLPSPAIWKAIEKVPLPSLRLDAGDKDELNNKKQNLHFQIHIQLMNCIGFN